MLTRQISFSATNAIPCKALEVALIRAMSLEPSLDSRWCCGVGISGRNEHVGEAGGELAGGVGGCGDAGGLRNVMGQLGLGARQFGLSERLGGLCRGSLCGGGSLRTSWDHGTRCWDS